ncbi:MAG: four helix bundle protein [Bacteroidales bacterium]|nr:four helix bundle protein [Bacteroidales bacterium]
MKPIDLKERTLNFTVRIMNFVESLPQTQAVRIVSNQLLRSSSSLGANYRAARRSKSGRDFINKLKIVEEETDETLYWLEVLEKRKIGSKEVLSPLLKEAHELLAIFVTSINTAKSNLSLQNLKK